MKTAVIAVSLALTFAAGTVQAQPQTNADFLSERWLTGKDTEGFCRVFSTVAEAAAEWRQEGQGTIMQLKMTMLRMPMPIRLNRKLAEVGFDAYRYDVESPEYRSLAISAFGRTWYDRCIQSDGFADFRG